MGGRSFQQPMSRFGSMTREQWQRNRSGGWGNNNTGAGAANPAATANAVNLIVGLSKML